MKSLLPAALAALLMTPAYAQDTADFSGAYVGLSANWTDTKSSDSASDIDVSSNGGTLTAGYLFDVGNALLGGEISYRRNSYSGTDVTTATAISGTATSRAVGLRVGYPIGRTMPYMAARIGRGTDDFDTGSLDFDTREFAIGAEYAVTDNLFTNVSVERVIFEYRDTDLNLRSNVLTLGLNYRF